MELKSLKKKYKSKGFAAGYYLTKCLTLCEIIGWKICVN